MSESMAFIGGVAVAGLAALVLLKGTNTPLQPNFAVAPQMPGTVVAPGMQSPMYPYGPYGQPVYPNPNQPPTAASADQRLEMEKLNTQMQLERLKNDNEQLKVQNQQLQGQVQNFNTQQQWQQAQQYNQQKAAAFQPQQNPSWWSSPMLWAVGGATLTIGGGVVVAGVLALFSPRQRPARTVQVIHPYQGNTPPLVPVRRAEFLPASRMEARRVEAPEYDEMH
ncbi:heterocyst differentiation related protein [Nostoc sp. 'Peltigera membranacea cyanobiont' 213]|uniref:heterocyst differentiation related protein n=1 Tax=unclassified Nostoc TaxID=2593658 RepID=UPI000B954FF2|nr:MULTISPECIES: heterocyst differentiation related protein [unclassified Nostoc]AVH62422.1 heterocyst differentiation related protein PatN [Nostoc sp. 'Peltigera membranacea cyanobiont' N6]OYD99190.1 heterocyst differentiation related protein [Nostoc sp. 'Peltigera membranacea cyanobiont' 213]